MQYVSGIHALNLPCKLETCGDWHQSAIQWEKPLLLDSDKMFFKDYGIESNHTIPEHSKEVFYVANTIRALLDLLEIGNFAVAQGMNTDFICNDKYDKTVFDKVSTMRVLSNWGMIDQFMEREYKLKWLQYKKATGISCEQNRYHSKHLVVGDVEQTAILKIQDYVRRDDIHDLYDLVFICNNHWYSLSKPVKSMIQHGFEQKGLDQFDYLIQSQSDELIDNDKLADDLLNVFDRLDIIANRSDSIDSMDVF